MITAILKHLFSSTVFKSKHQRSLLIASKLLVSSQNLWCIVSYSLILNYLRNVALTLK